MAFILKDRVKESTSTTGTGAISLGGSLATFDDFQTYMSNGDTTYYSIAHTTAGTDEWEVGIGTWNTGNTLTRTTVLAGSNGTSAVDLSAGDKDIFITYPADKAVFKNASGTVDGRDISADGTKLDGIESGATADQTKADIDALNIDADTLDGLQGSSFLRSDADDSASGLLTVSNDIFLGDSSSRHHLKISSDTYPEIRFFRGTTEKIRAGVANTSVGFDQAEGDFYIYSQPDAIMRLTVPINGDPITRNNGTVTVWDSSNDGSGSGLDADTLDSVQLSGIVQRDFQDSSRNLNIATGSTSAAGLFMKASDNSFRFQLYGDGNHYGFLSSDWGSWDLKKAPDGQLQIRVGGTDRTVWHAGNDGSGSGLDADTLDGVQGSSFLRSDATDNFTSLSGTTLSTSGELAGAYIGVENGSQTGGNGISLYNGGNTGAPTYGLMFSGTATFGSHGAVTNNNWATYFTMNNTAGRGWIFRNTDTGPVASIDNTGRASLKDLQIGGSGGTAHNVGGLQVSTTNEEKIVLSGSSNPYIRFQESTTDKAYIQWTAGNDSLMIRNQQGTKIDLRGNNGVHLRLLDNNGTRRGSVYATTSNEVGFLDKDDAWAYRHSGDSLHEWRINNSIEMSLSSATLDMKGNTITEVEDIGLRDMLYHDGDTDTYMQFNAANSWRVVTGNTERLLVNSSGVRLGDNGNGYFRPVSGSYGSIEIDGGGHNGWEGYNIGGRAVFMHDNSTTTGLFNDVHNHWLFLGIHNGESRMYHAGVQKIYTYSSGGRVTGNLLASSNVYAYYSDERLKAKDGVIEDALGKINSLETFYYHENDLAKEHGHDNDKRQLGVSAQQVEAILPECVAPAPFDLETDNEGNEWSKSGEDYLTVDYPRLVPLLIKGIQEQQDQIEMLKNEVKDLKDAINQ